MEANHCTPLTTLLGSSGRRLRYYTDVPGYHIENFGCRATQADGAALERQFDRLGVARTGLAQASVVVLNTCTVTAAADQDARAAIRRTRRQNPGAKIVVTGCYAQRAPEEIASLPGVSLVIGNSHKHQLAEIVAAQESAGAHLNFPDDFPWGASGSAMNANGEEEMSAPQGAFVPLSTLTAMQSTGGGSAIFVSDIFAHTELLAAPVFDAAGGSHGHPRTRPNLKVQDGCDNRCSFCVIPYVRGRSRSLTMERIIGEVNNLVESGYREVVISGINLGRWGRDLPTRGTVDGLARPGETGSTGSREARAESHNPTVESLIRAILAETGLEKLRISSVEPMDWSDDLITLVASSPRIAKHAHVPMQSGSDTVLRRMHRKYRPWHYRGKIEKIRSAMPDAAIGADVMVGFPGETDAEFEATRSMVEDLPFTYLHVFTYSPRPGTPAASMKDQVPIHVARERNRILRDLAAQKKLAFMRGFIGKSVEAISLRSGEVPSARVHPADALDSGASGLGGAAVFSRDFSAGRDSGLPASRSGHRDQKPDFTEALTDSYLKLYLRGCHDPNRWLRVHVEDVVDGALVGVI